MDYLIIQDMMDILYKINRIKNNSYDENFSKHLNNMSPVDRAEDLIKYISQNTDNATKNNVELLINLLRDVDSVKSNVNYMDHNKNINKQKYSNSSNKSIYAENDIINKIKYFLKSLNDE